MYVIKRTDQGEGYVTRPGSRSSYTSRLENARVFETREQAEGHRCPGNEIVVNVNDLLRRRL
jgi:hypothetical protein